MPFVCTWRWGSKWNGSYAERLLKGIRRNLRQPHKTVLITDHPEDNPGFDIICPIDADDDDLLKRPGCLVRMRMFDAGWQKRIGAKAGDRIVNIDIDTVVTGELDPLFDRDDQFTIMQGFQSTNPCPFNGSLWMLRAGERHDVFDDFSLDAYAARGVPYHSFPDDQGWLHYKFQNAAAYTPNDGVYAMKKNGWGSAGRRGLPQGARIVAFPGRNPAKYADVPWIVKHWVCEQE